MGDHPNRPPAENPGRRLKHLPTRQQPTWAGSDLSSVSKFSRSGRTSAATRLIVLGQALSMVADHCDHCIIHAQGRGTLLRFGSVPCRVVEWSGNVAAADQAPSAKTVGRPACSMSKGIACLRLGKAGKSFLPKERPAVSPLAWSSLNWSMH